MVPAPTPSSRARSFLYSVMEVDGFVKATQDEYKKLLPLLRSSDADVVEPRADSEPARRSSLPPAPTLRPAKKLPL